MRRNRRGSAVQAAGHNGARECTMTTVGTNRVCAYCDAPVNVRPSRTRRQQRVYCSSAHRRLGQFELAHQLWAAELRKLMGSAKYTRWGIDRCAAELRQRSILHAIYIRHVHYPWRRKERCVRRCANRGCQVGTPGIFCDVHRQRYDVMLIHMAAPRDWRLPRPRNGGAFNA